MLEADYTDFRLGQYGMEEKAYFAVTEEIKDGINCTGNSKSALVNI